MAVVRDVEVTDNKRRVECMCLGKAAVQRCRGARWTGIDRSHGLRGIKAGSMSETS